ncbi:uncharacterized protein EI97DRAFT_25631 [Westerdykella ornata]|uniref:MYND-type domain-containing protein n=1 Tax=Westerdykella ornata TaxID=318751 RepID=A0A6A6JY11_WESOR|nr:uncharacterized protein EI97DRAFT_25631 [Westerdykella ornata]KAF2281297.1 hypothetical protein EI97DRAFT_25631 [Westerdykella ornata]
MAATAMMPFLTPSLCANTKRLVDGNVEFCREAAGLACGACNLVQYCSKECQKAHWREHKGQCKSDLMQPEYVPAWAREGRTPSFIENDETLPIASSGQRRYLWGNMPALDIMKMKENEGLGDLGRDISLLFAASGDCRNIVKTIVGLPEGYTGQCTAVLNDRDFAVVARNAILLLLALRLDPEASAPMMIHLWYSALIPAIMLDTLQREILPYIENVCAKVNDKPAHSLQAKTFKFPMGSLRLLLKKEQWFRLASFFKVPDGLTCHSATTLRRQTTLNPDRKDNLDRILYSWPPGQRLGCMKFRAEGILLPFGSSTQEFDTPNPTFFQKPGVWPMKDDADPLRGWLHTDYLPYAPIAKADVYGSLFFFLGDLLLKFCKRVRNTRLSFQLYNVDVRELPSYLRQDGRKAFDRIEVDNICDRGYIGPSTTVSLFALLLQPKPQNPHATLILLFQTAVRETERALGHGYKATDLPRRLQRMRKLLGDWHTRDMLLGSLARPDAGEGEGETAAAKYNPELIRMADVQDRFGDFDGLFDMFWKGERMDEVLAANGVRVRVRKRGRGIVDQWPYRVRRGMTKEEFEVLCRVDVSGSERYVEVERVEAK